MLTFLLDKQGSSRLCQPCLNRSDAEVPLSVQRLRNTKASSCPRQSATVFQLSHDTAWQPVAVAPSARIAVPANLHSGTTSAHRHVVRHSSVRKRQTFFSRHITLLHFAHNVRSRTVWPSLARQPNRSHT